MLNLCELVRQCYNCHWKKDLCNQKGTNNEFHLLQMTDSGYFKVWNAHLYRRKSECFWNFAIPSSSQTQSLRWTFHYKLLVNNSDTQLSFLLLLITFIWKTVNLCTLFHISVANCKWGSVCNVESRTLLVGVCKLRTGESLMYLRHNHLCN